MATTTASNPTRDQWSAYQSAYDYFNVVLFAGELPRCILNFSRGRRYLGFFAARRWQNNALITHEISLNPDEFSAPAIEVMSTLVHEMSHLWKFEFGKKAQTGGYHCKEWANKMVEIGLMPYNINHPERQTGYRVSHRIVEEGAFTKAFSEMPPTYLIPWQSAPAWIGQKRLDNNDKVKYTCGCKHNVWGKSGLLLTCNGCQHLFQEQR